MPLAMGDRSRPGEWRPEISLRLADGIGMRRTTLTGVCSGRYSLYLIKLSPIVMGLY